MRGTSHGSVSVCVCLSQVGVLLQRQNVKRRITQTTPHDSPSDSSFLTPNISAKFRRGSGGVGQNRRLSTNNRLYLENGKDKHIVSIKVE